MQTRTCITCRKEKDIDEFEVYNANVNKSCEGCMAKIRRERGDACYDATIPRAALLNAGALEWLPSWGFKFDLNFDARGDNIRTMLPMGWAMRKVLGRDLVWDEKKILRLRIDKDSIEITPAVQITVDIEKHIKGIAGRSNWIIGVVRVCGEIVHKTNAMPALIMLNSEGVEDAKSRTERLQSLDFLQMICEKYISLKYPQHADPLAYWPKVAMPAPTVQLDLFTQKTNSDAKK